MANVFPLSTYYMWMAFESLPTAEQRKQAYIGERFLPNKDLGSYSIVHEEIQEFLPIAGFYAMTDLADPLHDLPWKTIQQDLIHSAQRWIINPQELMFFRMPAQPPGRSQWYGEGPAANDFRQKDQETVARKTKQMVLALDNLNEYMRINALRGRLLWPPRNAAGAVIPAADRPVYWGRQALDLPYALLAAGGGHGGFDQAATTLAGVAGGVTAQGVAWNAVTPVAATSANVIRDLTVIKSLMKKRKSLPSQNLLCIMSEEVLGWQTWNTNVLNWILGLNRDREFLTPEEILQAFTTRFSFTIETYDAVWEYVRPQDMNLAQPPVNSIEFLPVGEVLIIPKPEYVGMGYLGHCPNPFIESDTEDLLQWTNGRYFWRDFMKKPPFRREMGVGQFAFPIMINLDKRFRLQAWA
jgi:hypothetical protein